MSATLTIDTPESCAECPLRAKYGIATKEASHDFTWCVFQAWTMLEDIHTGRRPWCPLVIKDTEKEDYSRRVCDAPKLSKLMDGCGYFVQRSEENMFMCKHYVDGDCKRPNCMG